MKRTYLLAIIIMITLTSCNNDSWNDHVSFVFIGKRHLLHEEIDACNDGVSKHLGQIADSMTEWEGKISEQLLLTSADVAKIRTRHPNKLELQT